MNRLIITPEVSQQLSAIHASTGTGEVEAKLVVDRADHDAMLRLRHDAYTAVGYLKPTSTSTFADKYDALPTSRSLLLFRGGRPAASVRVCLMQATDTDHSAPSLPAAEIFSEEIAACLATGSGACRAVEITRLSRHPDYNRDTALMLALFRMAGYLILSFGADTIFAAIAASHIPFYRRMGFAVIAPPRDYPGLDVQTALVACAADRHMAMRGQLSALGTLSVRDAVYKQFMGGEIVTVEQEHERRRERHAATPSIASRAA